MQDIDRVRDVEPFAVPVGRHGVAVEIESLRDVDVAQYLDRIDRYLHGFLDLRDAPAVRTTEGQRAFGSSLNLKALFVDRAVVAATE